MSHSTSSSVVSLNNWNLLVQLESKWFMVAIISFIVQMLTMKTSMPYTCLHANDLIVMCNRATDLELFIQCFEQVTQKFWLTMSVKKRVSYLLSNYNKIVQQTKSSKMKKLTIYTRQQLGLHQFQFPTGWLGTSRTRHPVPTGYPVRLGNRSDWYPVPIGSPLLQNT